MAKNAKDNTPINVCAIVPVYRHEKASRSVVEKLVSYNLPVILIDDGNAPEGHEILVQIAKEFPHVNLVTHAVNRGKGGAVRTGMETAVNMGYTHALQVDADGRDDMEAIPFFVKAAQKHPKDMVCAFPQYDDSVPTAREKAARLRISGLPLKRFQDKFPMPCAASVCTR